MFEDPKKLLGKANRKLISICDDGNCMFRAIAAVMFKSETFHSKVRLVVHDYIQANMCSHQH